jgi:acetyltransferase-like isoleucine patch superfamily enzyme
MRPAMQNRPGAPLERKSLYLFNLYSYVYNVLFTVLELLPQFLRRVAFGAMFRKLGSGGLIDYRTHFRYPSKISIGENVFINHSCAFYGSSLPGVEIVVGDNVALGPHVKIFTASHDYSTWDLRDVAKSVVIGANSWVGGGSIILPGVTIGEGAVVGAGSVVSRDIEPFTIAVGNPARPVKRRNMQQ